MGGKASRCLPSGAFECLPDPAPEDGDLEKFVRLWLTEGVPFAFKDRPIVYEALREWVAALLDIFPKDVSMVGSARIGFSLAPQKQLREFTVGSSDLDLFVVSAPLFGRLSKGLVYPSNV